MLNLNWQYLPAALKLIIVGNLAALLTIFLPWWQITKIGITQGGVLGSGSYDVLFNGLTGIAIFGLVVFGLAIFGLYLSYLYLKGRRNYAQHSIGHCCLIIGSLAVFTLLLLIYTLLTLKFDTDFVGDATLRLRFGIYLQVTAWLTAITGAAHLFAEQRQEMVRTGFKPHPAKTSINKRTAKNTKQLSFADKHE